MVKSVGGSGRGNKGFIRNDSIERHDCPKCGGFMKSSGTRWRCTECDYQPHKIKKDDAIQKFNDSLGFDPIPAEAHARLCEQGERLIITSAQNNSEVDNLFLQSLKEAAKFYKCPLGIMPNHYQNLTLWKKGDKKEYDPFVIPYLLKSDVQFGNVKIRSDVRIMPTNINPLAGKQAHAGHEWLVFGHPQLAREPVATLGEGMPKLMFTTGSVTKPNYSRSNEGYKAEFHHCNAALILEKVGNDVFVRQLTADSKGHIHDLDARFTPNGVTLGHKIKALNTGDEHVDFNIVENETYGKNGITDLLKPEYIVRHDIADCYSISHHHEKNPMIQYMKHVNGTNDCKKELDRVIDFINRTTPKFATNLIVPSNHHDHLEQFLNRADANKDHVNALFILEMQAKMREAAVKGERCDPFYLYAKDKIKAKVKWLDRNKPFLVDGIELSQHGDVGSNGSRGSARGLARTPDRMTIGHSHSARICQGVYQAGTSTGRLEYERGLSDHSTSHVIQYKGGKRAIIDIINGRFCAPRPRIKK